MKSEFKKSSSIIRIEYFAFPVYLGDGSKRVENAAEAIGEDGVFFEFSAGGHFMTPHFEALRGIINAVLS